MTPSCGYYAIIRDGKSKQNLSLCAGSDRRITPFYVSKTHIVTFHFDKIQRPGGVGVGGGGVSGDVTQALLQYQSK